MRTIRFAKAQAVGNDFIVVDERLLREAGIDASSETAFARAICHRHLGVGADGVEILLEAVPDGADAAIRLVNSDGSPAELSGNGTRCVGAVLFRRAVAGDVQRVATEAGIREVRLIAGDGPGYELRMDMGSPRLVEADVVVDGVDTPGPAMLLDVGNPQCAFLVNSLEFDWRAVGRAVETHTRFARGTNVSFVRVLDEHTLDVRFWERGAGETNSSGTGSTGAAAAARFARRVGDDVCVQTVAGDIQISFDDAGAWLDGPAEIVAEGTYFYSQQR